MKKAKWVYPLCAAIILLCIAGIIVSIVNMVENGVYGLYDVLKYPFLTLLEVGCIVLVIAFLIRSEYVVTKTEFIARYGIVKNVFPLQKISSMLLDSDTQKLTLNMEEGYFIVSAEESENQNLIQALRENNPEIGFSFTNAEK